MNIFTMFATRKLDRHYILRVYRERAFQKYFFQNISDWGDILRWQAQENVPG